MPNDPINTFCEITLPPRATPASEFAVEGVGVWDGVWGSGFEVRGAGSGIWFRIEGCQKNQIASIRWNGGRICWRKTLSSAFLGNCGGSDSIRS